MWRNSSPGPVIEIIDCFIGVAPVQFYWSVYALFKRQVLVHNFRLAYGHIYDVISVLAIIVRVNIVFLHVDVIVVLIDIFFTIKLL